MLNVQRQLECVAANNMTAQYKRLELLAATKAHDLLPMSYNMMVLQDQGWGCLP